MRRGFVGGLLALLLCAGCQRAAPEWADGVRVPNAPIQTDYAQPGGGWNYLGARIVPVAEFEVEARVLAVKKYKGTATSDVLPYDVALGWQDMSDSQLLRKLTISQGERRYYYRWPVGVSLNGAAIATTSANMHIIPANTEVFDAMQGIRPNDRIIVTGQLVNVEIPGVGRLRTSTKRTDTWDGACEIIWATHIDVLTVRGH